MLLAAPGSERVRYVRRRADRVTGIVSRGGVPQVMGGEEVEFEDLTDEDWQNVLAVNLTGVFYCAKHAVPALKRNGWPIRGRTRQP